MSPPATNARSPAPVMHDDAHIVVALEPIEDALSSASSVGMSSAFSTFGRLMVTPQYDRTPLRNALFHLVLRHIRFGLHPDAHTLLV